MSLSGRQLDSTPFARQDGKDLATRGAHEPMHSSRDAGSLPAWNERALMASVYMWPLVEGLFR